MDKPSGGGKGKGKDKGKNKGGGKGKDKKSNKGKPGSNLCERWNQGHCTSDDCKYTHRCNRVLGGRVCAERHPAVECPHKGKF